MTVVCMRAPCMIIVTFKTGLISPTVKGLRDGGFVEICFNFRIWPSAGDPGGGEGVSTFFSGKGVWP